MLSRLLGISPNLLSKILIVASSGGSPVFYFGPPNIFNFGANRKIKWTLKDNEEVKGSERVVEKGDSGWTSKEKKWQDLEISKWNQVEDNGVKTIYKLMIKKEWTREESSFSGNNSVKGGLGLFKVSLKKNGRDLREVKLEEVNEDESKGVWLIVAKSQKSTYLIPVVRASKESGKLGTYRVSSKCFSGVNNVWDGGVDDLESWKDSKGLGEREQEELKNKLRNGFIIARGGKAFGRGLRWGSNGGRSSDIDSFVNGKPGRGWGEVVIYRNAGILVGKDKRGEACENNNQKTRYFPLDIKVLGGSELKELKGRSQASWSEIEVSEQIEEVGIYKWEEVMFNETGIGIKKGNELKWGTVNRLTWVPELLK